MVLNLSQIMQFSLILPSHLRGDAGGNYEWYPCRQHGMCGDNEIEGLAAHVRPSSNG